MKEKQNEDKNPYEIVVKKFLILLGLLAVSPILFSVAFKAQKIYTDAPHSYIATGIMVTAITLLIYTVYFGFKTFQKLIQTIFKDA